MQDSGQDVRGQRRRVNRRFSLLVGLVIAVAVVFVLAIQEFRTYGTDRVAPVTVASYKARAVET